MARKVQRRVFAAVACRFLAIDESETPEREVSVRLITLLSFDQSWSKTGAQVIQNRRCTAGTTSSRSARTDHLISKGSLGVRVSEASSPNEMSSDYCCSDCR